MKYYASSFMCAVTSESGGGGWTRGGSKLTLCWRDMDKCSAGQECANIAQIKWSDLCAIRTSVDPYFWLAGSRVVWAEVPTAHATVVHSWTGVCTDKYSMSKS